MFQNFDLDSGLSVYILDFSDKKIVSFKIYNVTRKSDEYSDYTPTLKECRLCLTVISNTDLTKINDYDGRKTLSVEIE